MLFAANQKDGIKRAWERKGLHKNEREYDIEA